MSESTRKPGQNGKGSTPRPLSISHDKFADNWDKIFGKKSENHNDRKIESNHNEDR